jgi:hypothetical protein
MVSYSIQRNRLPVGRYLALLILTFTTVAASGQQQIVLEDFEGERPGSLPSNWYNRDGNAKPATYSEEARAEYHYKVTREQGRTFLRYEGSKAKHLLLQIPDEKLSDVRQTPILSWDWRIHAIPSEANEFSEKRNDAAASIYVVWGFNALRVPKVVRYTWSSTVEVGRTAARNMNMQHIVVMATGTKNLGRWMTFERNIVEDYNRFFRGTVPKKPVAILILSDADDTGSFTKADYDRIVLKSVP